ncbi:hypothetical protein [Actinomadura kijaniata]|uniref:hypothetical protein n=1 Tax=Actinomadura kijaniata TaxID=46161 RepID=UPI000A40B83D|nr:hypothetical protein [Actinomadura kijaniata]
MEERSEDQIVLDRIREGALGADQGMADALLQAADKGQFKRMVEIATDAVRGVPNGRTFSRLATRPGSSSTCGRWMVRRIPPRSFYWMSWIGSPAGATRMS